MLGVLGHFAVLEIPSKKRETIYPKNSLPKLRFDSRYKGYENVCREMAGGNPCFFPVRKKKKYYQ